MKKDNLFISSASNGDILITDLDKMDRVLSLDNLNSELKSEYKRDTMMEHFIVCMTIENAYYRIYGNRDNLIIDARNNFWHALTAMYIKAHQKGLTELAELLLDYRHNTKGEYYKSSGHSAHKDFKIWVLRQAF